VRINQTIILLIICTLSLTTKAQNLYRFSQFDQVRSLYNPAAMGSEASLAFDLIYRNQWAGIDGAPQTAGFAGSYDIHS
jgi:hypothetical protein